MIAPIHAQGRTDAQRILRRAVLVGLIIAAAFAWGISDL